MKQNCIEYFVRGFDPFHILKAKELEEKNKVEKLKLQQQELEAKKKAVEAEAEAAKKKQQELEKKKLLEQQALKLEQEEQKKQELEKGKRNEASRCLSDALIFILNVYSFETSRNVSTTTTQTGGSKGRTLGDTIESALLFEKRNSIERSDGKKEKLALSRSKGRQISE